MERRTDEAFLLYVIALESFVLPKRDTDIGYRLKVRVTHLLACGVDNRRSVTRKISELYSTRSQIAHAGVSDITEAELNTARRLTKQVLLLTLRGRHLKRVHTGTIDDWFESRILM